MKWNAALVGCGAIAPIHGEALKQCDQANLVTVMDLDQDKAVHMAAQYGVTYETDYQRLLKRDDVQVIHICTPHYTHAALSLEALRAGKHVVLEKPVALNVAEAQELQQTADQLGLQIGVVYQNRYNPSSLMMKQYVDEQKLGAFQGLRAIMSWKRDASYYATAAWRGKWDTEGGGLLINQAIHTIDLMQWLGGAPIAVTGVCSNLSLQGVIEVEDTAQAVLTFAGGQKGIFFGTNAHMTSSPIQFEVYFEQGIVKFLNNAVYVEQAGVDTLVCEPPPPPEQGKSNWGVSHAYWVNDFYDHLSSGKPFPIDATEGAKSLKIVLEIYKQFRRN